MRKLRVNEATRFQKATVLLAVLVLTALAAMAVAADTDMAKKTGAIQNPEGYIAGYTIETQRVDYLADPPSLAEKKHLFMTPSTRVNDLIPQPTWQAPHKVVDVRKDYPLVQGAMNRVLFSPEIFREGFMRNADPNFVGRNSIPLREVEQIVVDIPRSFRRQDSKIDMIADTFGRGVVDFFCGWIEIPRCISREMQVHEPHTGAAVGAAKGVMRTFLRTVSGAKDLVVGTVDMVTFPFHDPESLDHRPWMEPEWVFDDIWEERVPYLNDDQGPRAFSHLTTER